MTLAPLLDAPAVVQFHAFGAMAAFGLGLVQLVLPKGGSLHRVFGWTWVIVMAAIALASFFIHDIRLWGAWSPIHILSVVALISLVAGVWHARRGAVAAHRFTMLSLFFGALVIAGAFTFVPGRIMYAVAFG